MVPGTRIVGPVNRQRHRHVRVSGPGELDDKVSALVVRKLFRKCQNQMLRESRSTLESRPPFLPIDGDFGPLRGCPEELRLAEMGMCPRRQQN
jgi:hypothetical protein